MAQWLRSLSLVRRIPGSIPGIAQNAHFITATDSWGRCSGCYRPKLTVSSNQGNARMFVHPTLGIMEEHLYAEQSTQAN